jgi:hypothetical protein
VFLWKEIHRLTEIVARLTSIAPRKINTDDGKSFIWRCPDELVPDKSFFVETEPVKACCFHCGWTGAMPPTVGVSDGGEVVRCLKAACEKLPKGKAWKATKN